MMLGAVQGLTEFLPISSSAHLILIPNAFRLPAIFGTAQFDIMLHAGSFIAILIALRRDWLALVRGALRGVRSDLRYCGFLLLTSIPGAIFGVLFEKQAESAFRAPLRIAAALMAFGLLLWAIDRFVTRMDGLETMSWAKAGLIGLAQALALLPGVSRAGSTITAGRALGLSREAIAKYSFMAALPIIGGAAVFGLRDVSAGTLFSAEYLIGFLAATLSSFTAMKVMLGFVRKHSLAVFAWYRLALGVVVIALVLAGVM